MNFCTLFDSNYISKGLALYHSIARYTDDFVMYVMAMDDKSHDILSALALPQIVVEKLSDNMTDELQTAYHNRSKAEFCWTCGSYVTDLFLHKYNLDDLAYLDSDLMFFSNPKIIFDELNSKKASVGLSPHFVPYNAFGKYCVQFFYCRNDESGIAALRWWKEECLKWCYSYLEGDKYGDQKYLDYIAKHFRNVHDIENRGAGMAYWNEFDCKYHENGLDVRGHYYPYVFFHYSGFKITFKNGRLLVTECYPVGRKVWKYMLLPYVDTLCQVYKDDLHQNVESVVYMRKYFRRILCYVLNFLKKFDLTHKLISAFFTLKYSKRRSPYSERNSH